MLHLDHTGASSTLALNEFREARSPQFYGSGLHLEPGILNDRGTAHERNRSVTGGR